MFYKQIFRNWLPAVYLSIGILSFLLFLVLISVSKEDKISWMLFTVGGLSLNVLNIGYFNFGFSFDYHKLLNIRSTIQIRKFLNDQFRTVICCTLISSFLMILLLFAENKINDKVIYIILCAITLIPCQIVCYIILFRKLNLFDTRFIIIKQTALNYLTSVIQIIFILSYYFLINNLVQSLLLLIVIYLIFFFKLKYLVSLLIKKINDEYIRN